MEGIKLVQKPVISHVLEEIGKKVDADIKELNLDNIIASEDNRKHLKGMRTRLNQDFSSYEEERKSIKNGVLSPYNEFEALYKMNISEKYKDADTKLKKAIDSVEDGIKKEKESNINRYFNELCASYGIDFLKLSDVGLNINLTATEKKLKEETGKFVERIDNDIKIIESLEYVPEMLAEYKSCLDAGKAINIVRDRFKKIEEEKQRKKIKEKNRRTDRLKSLGFFFDEMVKSYIYDDNIYMSLVDIEGISADDFNKKIIELDEAIEAKKTQDAKPEPTKQEDKSTEQISAPKPKEEPAPLSAPKEEKRHKARFEVYGTMSELRTIGAWLKSNNYEYKNI